MKGKWNISKLSVLFYWLLFLALLGMFFTNDFGLVDIHKTSIITAIGVDCYEEEVKVTAEIAVPQPSQSGENIKYIQVQGSGLTIADALNEINSKTGFYPKLQFCNLILVGESCRDKQLFRVLGCFYRKNYSELTASIAMCKGNAADMLAQKSDVSEMTSEAIRKVLSDEIEKSANANSANLKEIAAFEFSKSGACYMPYLEISEPGTSEEGGNGDNVGGEDADPSGSGGSSGNGNSSGESGNSSGESGNSGGAQSGEAGGSKKAVEFTARKTAYFSNGEFRGILNEQQAFALAILKSDIRLAVLPCDAEDVHYTIGLKEVDGGIKLKVNDGVPEVEFSVSADAQIQGIREKVNPSKTVKDDILSDAILNGAIDEIKNRIQSLFAVCRESDCDILGLKELLYKYDYKHYEALKDELYASAEIKFDIKIVSVS